MALVDSWLWGLVEPYLIDELRLIMMEVPKHPNLIHWFEEYRIVEIKWGFYANMGKKVRCTHMFIASWNLDDDSVVYIMEDHDRPRHLRGPSQFVDQLTDYLFMRYYVEHRHYAACVDMVADLQRFLEETGQEEQFWAMS